MSRMDENLAQEYRENGYVVIRRLLSPLDVEPLRKVIDEVTDQKARTLMAQGKIQDRCEHLGFEQRLAGIYAQMPEEPGEFAWNVEVFSQAMYDLYTQPALLDVAEILMGPEICANGDYWVRPKLPHQKLTTLPWHQDSAYYGEATAESHIMSLWVPLVDVDEGNGCLQVIPGSHRWGLQTMHRVADYPLAVPVTDPTTRAAALSVPMEVGDVLAFHNLTFHRSLMNRSDRIRWSVDLRYSPLGTPLDWLKDSYPGFVALSRREPETVEGWEQWKAKRPHMEGH